MVERDIQNLLFVLVKADEAKDQECYYQRLTFLLCEECVRLGANSSFVAGVGTPSERHEEAKETPKSVFRAISRMVTGVTGTCSQTSLASMWWGSGLHEGG